MSSSPLFHKVDSLQLPVPTLGAGLAFYRDALGHQLLLANGSKSRDREAFVLVGVTRIEPVTSAV